MPNSCGIKLNIKELVVNCCCLVTRAIKRSHHQGNKESSETPVSVLFFIFGYNDSGCNVWSCLLGPGGYCPIFDKATFVRLQRNRDISRSFHTTLFLTDGPTVVRSVVSLWAQGFVVRIRATEFDAISWSYCYMNLCYVVLSYYNLLYYGLLVVIIINTCLITTIRFIRTNA